MKCGKKCIALVGIIAVSFLLFVSNSNDEQETRETPTVSADISVGQNLIVGIDSFRLNSDTIEFLTRVKPGGIILYRQANIQNVAQLTSFISELQELAVETTGMPYFIFLDEEPGGATRLDLFQDFSPGAIEWKNIETDIKKMQKVGINVELAPVADFVTGEEFYMSKRSPFRNERELEDFNDKFIKILDMYSISATLKHFPGIGELKSDPHKALYYVRQSTSTLAKALSVFKRGIDSGARFVMTNHGIFSDIDSENSITFSKRAIDILRNELEFQGIIITDDISGMPLAYQGNDFATRALLSGHTMVMLSWKRETMETVWGELLSQYEDGGEIRKRVDSNHELISRYKGLYINSLNKTP